MRSNIVILSNGKYEFLWYSDLICTSGAYEDWIQDLVTPAQYWQDPLNSTNYRLGSHFLAPINNELGVQTEEHKTRIEQLENFVMVMFNQDDIVDPKESAHFEFYTPGQDSAVLPLNESDIYKQDWLGLRQWSYYRMAKFKSTEPH